MSILVLHQVAPPHFATKLSPCLQKPKALCATSNRQYTTTVGDAQVVGRVVGLTSVEGNNEIDARTRKAYAVLREVNRSVVTKLVVSNTSKLSIYKYVFVPILACGH